MNGNVALDTSVAIAVLNEENRTKERFTHWLQVFLPLPVAGELIFGALNSQRSEANLARLHKLFQRTSILEMGYKTATVYANTRRMLKQRGQPIPENDVWIAALCLEHNLPLVTEDVHFKWVEGLLVERL